MQRGLVDRCSRAAAVRWLSALALAAGAFVAATLLARLAIAGLEAVVGLTPGPDTAGLLVSVLTFQGLGVSVVVVAFLRGSGRLSDWRSYLRLERLTMTTVFHGTVVAFAAVVVLGLGTLLASLVGTAPAESTGGERTNPAYFAVLFLVSTFVAAPMEEVFFRGFIQRHLADRINAAVGIAVASLLFMLIHTGVLSGDGARLATLGIFVGLGVVLGLGYHYTENLFVPVIGHALFNGIQILLRLADLLS